MAIKQFSFEDLDNAMTKIDPSGSIATKNDYSRITEWIGLGNYLLNAQVSGSIRKGMPNARSITFSGNSGTGKTFLILNACREAQKMGYFVIYGDSEAAVDEDLMKKFGLDPNRVRYQPLKTVLQTRHVVKNLCKTLKEKIKGGFEIPKIMFIVDSLGNLATEKETDDAVSGSDKRDMTKQQNLKSMFRVITGELAELKIPLIIANHVYASVGSYIPMNVQSGGCMIPGTKVRTCEGLKNIEDIKKGDLIPTLGGDKEVDAIWTFEKHTYTITLEGGLEYQVSDNHRFLVNLDYSKSESWKYITELKEGDLLVGDSNQTFKVLEVKESGTTKVHDLTVRDVEHYILESGVISHNTGMVYATSFICDLSKAGLDEAAEGQDASLRKSGIVVTSKVTKGRFARPIPIKFHISFYKGMNPYVGLENYVSWEACGIGRGKLIEEILETPIFEEDGVTQKILRGKPAVKKEKTGRWIYEEDPDAKTFAVKHLNKVVKGSALFTKEVFTEEILDLLDEKVIRPTFELPEIMGDEEELDDILEEESDSDDIGLDDEV